MTRLALTFVALSLTACASQAPAPPEAPTAQIAAVTPCDGELPVLDHAAAYTVEGFDGGRDSELYVTKRRAIKRCAPAVVQNRKATLDALR